MVWQEFYQCTRLVPEGFEQYYLSVVKKLKLRMENSEYLKKLSKAKQF